MKKLDTDTIVFLRLKRYWIIKYPEFAETLMYFYLPKNNPIINLRFTM